MTILGTKRKNKLNSFYLFVKNNVLRPKPVPFKKFIFFWREPGDSVLAGGWGWQTNHHLHPYYS